MYLHSKLEEHKENINIALIGCGKFISMFLSQYNQLKQIKIDSIVDAFDGVLIARGDLGLFILFWLTLLCVLGFATYFLQ